MPYYAVIGRVHGDDEDTCLILDNPHENAEQARQDFLTRMRDINNDPNLDFEDEDIPVHQEVYVVFVLQSFTPITLSEG